MQSKDANSCAICERPQEDGVHYRPDGQNGLVVSCPQCGTYGLGSVPAIARSFSWSPEIRPALSCAARQASESGQQLQIDGPNVAEIADNHSRTRVNDNINRLLVQIAARSGRPGGLAEFNVDTDFTLIDCYSRGEFHQYIHWIHDAGLVKQDRSDGPKIHVALTMAGWNRVQPLSRPGGIPGRCFVAMWFHDSMTEIFELGISKAVTDCGFPAPLRIDRKEHNNQITDEIIAAIRDAEFVVADFTGNRGGVYYEAGFARGLGRPVIHCCRDSDFGERHFDTKLAKDI